VLFGIFTLDCSKSWSCWSVRPSLLDQDQSYKTKIKTKTRLARPRLRPQPTRPRPVFVGLRPVWSETGLVTRLRSDHITDCCFTLLNSRQMSPPDLYARSAFLRTSLTIVRRAHCDRPRAHVVDWFVTCVNRRRRHLWHATHDCVAPYRWLFYA